MAPAVPVPKEGVGARGRRAACLAAQPRVRRPCSRRFAPKDALSTRARLRAAGKKVDGDVRARSRVRAWPVAHTDVYTVGAAARTAVVRREAVYGARDAASRSAARSAARRTGKDAHRELLGGHRRRRRGRRRRGRRHGHVLDEGDAPLHPAARRRAHPMTRARARATSRDVRHVPREQVTETRPIAKECKVAAAQAKAARGAAGLAAARRIRRVLQEAVGHVGCGACAVAPRCRV